MKQEADNAAGRRPAGQGSRALRMARLLFAYSRATLARNMAYPWSMAFEQLSYLVQLAMSLLLWRYLFTRLPVFEGWSFDAILVLHFFGNLFLALFHSIFMGFHTFYAPIRTGALDLYLCRPVDPRLAFMAATFRPEELLNRLLALVPLALYMGSRGLRLEPLHVGAGLLVMTIGLAAFALIQLTMGYAAFWFTRGDTILSFLDLFYGFYRFPLNALPAAAQVALGLLAPVVLAVTYPALFVAGGCSARVLAATAGAGVLLLTLWFLLEEWLWRRGLAAYQSPGG